MTSTRLVTADVTCLGCGCACDDIAVVVEDGRLREARNACGLGAEWFGDGRAPEIARFDGREVPRADALVEASRMLVRAARSLVYLAPDISCETQRHGAAIADVLRGVLDSVTSATALPAVLASQERGFAAATLGELRNRADTVVFWAVDPDHRYPRFATRYAPEPAGLHVPDGRRARMVIAVDVGARSSPADADRRVSVNASDEIAALGALRALVSGTDEDARAYASCAGPAWERARELAAPLLEAHYIALVYDAEPDGEDAETRSRLRFDALASLGQALNARTRCAAVALRAGGNRSGADAVLCAQTGYPLAIDFSLGYPRYRPHDLSAPTCVTRGLVDAALVLGSTASLPAGLTAALGSVPCVVIGPRASATTLGSARVTVDTGVAGIHCGGTALRMDDVPLPLRAPLPGLPDATDVARELLANVRARLLAQGAPSSPGDSRASPAGLDSRLPPRGFAGHAPDSRSV